MKKVISAILIAMFSLPIMLVGQERISLPLGSFNSIEIDAGINIFISQAPVCGVFIEGPEELRNDIQVKIDSKGNLKLISGDKIKKAEKNNQLDKLKFYFRAPEYNAISLAKSASLITETDLDCARLTIELKDNASFTSKRINAKEINVKLDGNTSFRGTLYAKSLKIDAKGNSKINIPDGDLSKSITFTLKDRAEALIEKSTGNELDVVAKDNAVFNGTFNGKIATAKASGNSHISLSGSISSSSLIAKDVTVINIANLECTNVKSQTEKAGTIQR